MCLSAYLCFCACHLCSSCNFKKGRGEGIKNNEMSNKSSFLFVFLIDDKYFEWSENISLHVEYFINASKVLNLEKPQTVLLST